MTGMTSGMTSTTGMTSRTSCFYTRNGKLDTKWRRRKTKTGKKTQGLLWMVNCPSTEVVSENVFCQGMVVLLNPVCNWLSEMLHVYKSEVRVAVFET